MPVARDAKTNRWFFRAIVRHADGRRERLYGTPGSPGPYQDISNTKLGAIEAETRAKSCALHGKLPERKEVDARTIRQHAATFLDLYKPDQKPSELRSKRQILTGHLLPYFGETTIAELTQADVDAFAKQELRRCSVKTVNNRLGVLSSLIAYATGVESELRLHLDGMGAEVEAVAMADVDRLLDAATDARYRVAVLLAAEAGLRAGEIRGLQWGDVRDGIITVRRALDSQTNELIAPKHNKTRTVPVSERLVDELAALPKRGLWIVSRRDGEHLGYFGLRDAIAGLYDRAGVPRPSKVIHCLRHTFGTEMARRIDLGTLQRLMGHESVTTTMRYVSVGEDQKRAAIATVFGRRRGSNVPVRTKTRR